MLMNMLSGESAIMRLRVCFFVFRRAECMVINRRCFIAHRFDALDHLLGPGLRRIVGDGCPLSGEIHVGFADTGQFLESLLYAHGTSCTAHALKRERALLL